jgi:methionyl-tRNA formyltransferase
VCVDPALIACGDGACVELLEVQPAGRKPMPWRAFANGAKPAQGLVLTSA